MRSLPKFSVENPVLVGVVMAAVLIGGTYAAFTLTREMFPESRPNQIIITTLYPGATPLEVEKGVSKKLEEVIKDIEHIDKIETNISEGVSSILVSMTNDVDDLDQKVNEFKAAVDAIPADELPADAERTIVAKFEPRLPVISVAVYGDISERELKNAAQDLRDEILLLPNISDVALSGIRKGELSVTVDPEKMVEYGLSLAQVTQAIRAANLDLPAGILKTPTQDVAIRTLGETDDAERIRQTILRTTPAGEVIRVSDIGDVIDGFEDTDVRGRFNGKPAADITVYKTGDQDAVEIASIVKAYVAGRQRGPLEWDWQTRLHNAFLGPTQPQKIYRQALNQPLPAQLQLHTHSNLARFIEQRLELLTRNGFWGLIFVFLSLLAFLNWRVAFWVLMGLVFSVCGAIMLMSAVGATLNLISMFGLIVVLGLIVDDAIVVGENIYAHVERGTPSMTAAVEGAREVTWPVVIAVLTTIGAFLPLMFIEGRIGDFMGVLPVVVMCALSMSLLESLSILPSHLAEALHRAHIPTSPKAPPTGWRRTIHNLRTLQKDALQQRMGGLYRTVLEATSRYRYLTTAAAVSLLLMAAGLVAGGRVPFVFIQKMDSETILANLEMPVGTPAEQTERALQVIEEAVLELQKTGEVKTVYTLVGAQIDADEGGATASARSHLGQVIVELSDVDQRDRSSDDIINHLRQKTRNLVGVNALKYRAMAGGPAGTDIEIEVTGENMDAILAAANNLKTNLADKAGVYDIADDYEAGRRELQIELLDAARPLGITTQSLATEIRGAFYGLEARTIQRDREDVDIRVRYPEHRRRQIHELEEMRIATPNGQMVPFREVANLVEDRGPASMRRVDQRRAVVVSADVDQNKTNAELIIADLRPAVAQLEKSYPGLRVDFAGNKRETRKSLGSLQRDFLIAVLLIYVMLAGLFRSYIQPLVVLTAVPFGLIGAVSGHYLMGYPLTMLSMIGLVALTGIVVNDALILVDFVNKERAAGKSPYDAVISAGQRRLRPILLTSLTTILGLAPLMTETSFQARFLIPMAISISFGLAFATVLTLIVVPSIYLIFVDLKRATRWAWTGSTTPLTAG